MQASILGASRAQLEAGEGSVLGMCAQDGVGGTYYSMTRTMSFLDSKAS